MRELTPKSRPKKIVAPAITSMLSLISDETNFSNIAPNTHTGMVAIITQKPILAIGVTLRFTQASTVNEAILIKSAR